ncbi:DUF2924 domain-containing protein [Methylobacter sp. sgz302048]|uniref:DUF2924 domain-containing protein n=1 Tax=Methylobacter sp. sgz302048 TaxID=3455945 RepID=UPI003F9F4D5F
MNIEIDFDVFKALTAKRANESVSYNDVLREILELDKPTNETPKPPESPTSSSKKTAVFIEPSAKANTSDKGGEDWKTSGVVFPHGTEFRTKYKGTRYSAKVDNGALVLNGKRFDSPSAAATSITNTSVNGWIFWECRFPSKTYWEPISITRTKQQSSDLF